MKKCYFSIATAQYVPMFEMLKNSLRKFDKNTDFILFGEEEVRRSNDQMLFYRAAPYFANLLFDQGYEAVCKIDADTLILGNLDHIWEEDYDAAVIQNSNPKEVKTYPVAVWDINPMIYVNAGLVVMKNKQFIEHWLKLCYSPHFDTYQFKEQDLLNILVYYGNYKIKFLDQSDKWHGLVSKQYTAKTILKDGKIMLPRNEEWPQDSDKEIVAYQWAGGHQAPDKMKYNLIFPEEVSKHIDKLVKP